MDDFNTNSSTLKIGFKNYTIEKPDEIEALTEGTCFGMVNYEKAKIRIASKFEQNDKNHTLIHEMMHCICMRFGLRDLSDDEHMIDLLATGIYEAILDNPHLFKMADV